MASMNEKSTGSILPLPGPVRSPGSSVHPAVYIAAWILLSSSVILYNKYILDRLNFHFPIFLTTFHLAFATVMTQILARTTSMLDSRKKVPMTTELYFRAIVPIGFFFSLSLICGNIAYLYLSVSFIQMLKATTPVVVLLAGWFMGTKAPDYQELINVGIIVFGVMIASASEIKFVTIGVIVQLAGISFEAIRIVMVERLLNSPDFKMDPIVSLYYYAPACTVMNAIAYLIMEANTLSFDDILAVGFSTLLSNAVAAFALNVAVVLLLKKTSSIVYTLSGVIKDIILVVASIALFGDPVSLGQVFGYAIALVGLVYYKLGPAGVKENIADGVRMWTEYGMQYPARRRALSFAIAAVLFFSFLHMMGVTGSRVADIIGERT